MSQEDVSAKLYRSGRVQNVDFPCLLYHIPVHVQNPTATFSLSYDRGGGEKNEPCYQYPFVEIYTAVCTCHYNQSPVSLLVLYQSSGIRPFHNIFAWAAWVLLYLSFRLPARSDRNITCRPSSFYSTFCKSYPILRNQITIEKLFFLNMDGRSDVAVCLLFYSVLKTFLPQLLGWMSIFCYLWS